MGSRLPRVLNRHRDRIDWSRSVSIMRGTPYGNPFKEGTQDEKVDRFEREILPTLDVSRLKGLDLVCCCKPKRCHGDSILLKANWPEEET